MSNPLSTFTNAWMTKLLILLLPFLKTKFQTRTLIANITVNNSDVPGLRFINLIIGNKYRIAFQHSTILASGNNHSQLRAIHDGITIAASLHQTTGNTQSSQQVAGGEKIFTATDTTLVFNWDKFGTATLIGTGSNPTFATLEELPNHEETTDFS